MPELQRKRARDGEGDGGIEVWMDTWMDL